MVKGWVTRHTPAHHHAPDHTDSHTHSHATPDPAIHPASLGNRSLGRRSFLPSSQPATRQPTHTHTSNTSLLLIHLLFFILLLLNTLLYLPPSLRVLLSGYLSLANWRAAVSTKQAYTTKETTSIMRTGDLFRRMARENPQSSRFSERCYSIQPPSTLLLLLLLWSLFLLHV